MIPIESPHDRYFWSKITVDLTPGACWVWNAAKTATGYGQFGKQGTGRTSYAHRLSYEQIVGPVPEGLELDHTCRNRACVNPSHLEPVSHAENMRRGIGGWNHRIKTQCRNGHPYDEANTYVNRSGERSCRTCGRDRMRLRRSQPTASATTPHDTQRIHGVARTQPSSSSATHPSRPKIPASAANNSTHTILHPSREGLK